MSLFSMSLRSRKMSPRRINRSETVPGPLPAEREAGFILLPVCFLLPGPVLAWLFPGLSPGLRSAFASFIVLLCSVIIFRKSLLLRLRMEKPAFRYVLLPFLESIVIYLLCLFAVSFVMRLCAAGQNPNDDNIRSMLAASGPLFAIALLITGPVSEEIFFRYFVFTSLKKHGIIVSIVLTFLIFATLHLIPYVFSSAFPAILLFMLQYLPATLSLCLLYTRTDSLSCAILLHVLINVFSMTYYLSVI